MIASLATRAHRSSKQLGKPFLPKFKTTSILNTVEETRPRLDIVYRLDLFHHAFGEPRLRKAVIVVKLRDIPRIRFDEDIQEGDLEHYEPKACLGLFKGLLKPIVVWTSLHDLQLGRILQDPAHIAHNGFLKKRAVELCPTDWVGDDWWERKDKRNEDDQFTEVWDLRLDAGSGGLDEPL
jgi:hypothetical protein